MTKSASQTPIEMHKLVRSKAIKLKGILLKWNYQLREWLNQDESMRTWNCKELKLWIFYVKCNRRVLFAECTQLIKSALLKIALFFNIFPIRQSVFFGQKFERQSEDTGSDFIEILPKRIEWNGMEHLKTPTKVHLTANELENVHVCFGTLWSNCIWFGVQSGSKMGKCFNFSPFFFFFVFIFVCGIHLMLHKMCCELLEWK